MAQPVYGFRRRNAAERGGKSSAGPCSYSARLTATPFNPYLSVTCRRFCDFRKMARRLRRQRGHAISLIFWHRSRGQPSKEKTLMASNLVPITVAHGDGIGPEIMAATLHILNGAGARIAPE